jgi:hypothetical protein
VDAPRKLLDLGLGIIDVLLRDGIVFSFLQFLGLRARVFPGHVVVASAGAGDEFDLETDGFGHRTFLYALSADQGIFGAETSAEAANVKKSADLQRSKAVPEKIASQS